MQDDKDLSALQREWVRYMLRPESENAALLASDMGLGKTRTALMFAREGGYQVVLASVPLQTIDGWETWARVETPHLPVRRIENSIEGARALADFQWRQAGVYFVTHQYWERLAWTRKVAKRKGKEMVSKEDTGRWGGGGYLFIFDESHWGANWQSWTNRALMNVKADYAMSLSGTFAGDQFDGAYGATRWLWPHRTDIVPKNIYDWRAKWALTEYSHFAPRNQKTVGEKDPGAFVSSLPCYIRVETDLPAPIVKDVWVDLYPEQRRVYDELEHRMVAWIEENPLSADLTITKIARQRQATLAMPTLAFDGDELVSVDFEEDAESAKIDRLFQAIDGNDPELGDLLVGEKLVIATDSQKFARILTSRLNNRYGADIAREWSGKVKRDLRKDAKEQFINGSVRYLVGVPAAMGTGTDGLQHASHIGVFMSRENRRINNEQFVGRLNRKGQEKPVHIVSILANNTVDTGQLSKQMQDAINMAKIQRKKARLERG